MAPTTKTTASRAAASTSSEETMNQPEFREELLAAQAEIRELRAQLEAHTPRDPSPSNRDFATVLEALVQQLPPAAARPERSAKVADPPVLTDGTDPSFDNWRLQLRDKLEVNADHFPNLRTRMAYVFGRTGGDAQTHLRARYAEESADSFTSDAEMVAHLASIYEDPFRV